MANFRVLLRLLVALLLVSAPLVRVARCDGDADADAAAAEVVEGGDLGIVGEEAQDYGEESLTAAPGVDTTYVFPKNAARLVTAGEETELVVGVSNGGEAEVRILAIRASLHYPFDHQMLVQNLTFQEFYNATVPSSTQASFPYIFAVSKYLQPGSFDLVGSIFYEIDQHPHLSIFYNGTIEVVEAGSLLSMESVFLITLALALLLGAGLWLYGRVQNLSKKTKRVAAPKVEVGTATTDANMDEWLAGTAYAKTNKSKKKAQ